MGLVNQKLQVGLQIFIIDSIQRNGQDRDTRILVQPLQITLEGASGHTVSRNQIENAIDLLGLSIKRSHSNPLHSLAQSSGVHESGGFLDDGFSQGFREDQIGIDIFDDSAFQIMLEKINKFQNQGPVLMRNILHGKVEKRSSHGKNRFHRGKYS